MIAKLSGHIDHIADTFVILEVNGVGYKVFCSNRTLSQLPSGGEPCKLYIETVVREDAFILYGFQTAEEQAWFTLLTTVQGVGARVAQAILSVSSGNDLALAITSQDKAFITQADGVGPKLATRIVSELKDKVGTLHPMGTSDPAASFSGPINTAPSHWEDAISALTNLGYKRMEATQAIQNVSKDQQDLPVEALIREGLKHLSAA